MMSNFNDYIKKQGSLYLNDISYKLVTVESNPERANTVIRDSLNTELINDNKDLRVVFTRNISFEPQKLYELSVSFGAIYSFKDSYTYKEVIDIDFTKLVIHSNNILFSNIISRTSMLISQITSSHGQYPLVTPPLFLTEN